LGDGGIALITFSSPIIDGEGEDFCVFENGFNSTYLELGFVEVSSDGEHFYRFPATSYTTYNDIRPELLNNIAGKHEVGWGTPFDLSEIEDDEFFNRNNVRYVRIVDIIGGLDTDSQGNVIYDGTSGGPSTGYDLTGVGVLNQGSSYFVADCEGLLTSADTHELISADNGEMDADGNYRLSYLSNGLLYDALGLYGGMFACGFGPSNHTTSTGVTSYSSASLCGLEGAGNTYMIGYYSDWIGTEEHNVVRKEDDTPFYPIGVYVNNSMSAYNYMNTASFANDGHYLNIIATGYDENGNVTGSSITSLANANNVVKEWKYFDLTPLNECVKVIFTLQTDDDSGYGMNIPAYFCIDAFSYVNTIDASTPCDAPTNLSASNITETSAEITWNGTATTYEFKVNGGEAETLTATSKTLTDLTPNTAYIVEVRAICEDQTSDWVITTFTTLEEETPEIIAPVATTLAATEITNATATLNGIITAGSEEITAQGFMYKASNATDWATVAAVGETMSLTVEGLEAELEYVFKAFATTASGTVEGEELTFTTLSGLSDVNSASIIANVYPNPADDKATINVSKVSNGTKIVVSDMQGRIILSDEMSESTYELNTSNYASGVYYIRIISGNAVNTQKFIVK
ncbi:MAG: DUF4465 domain-containing protein, partial [Bacteroidales bacterium]|nr:DUF4465 domain-containing protein [Bacteroidales bacterium]